jgi:hypothetical protein
MFNNSLTVSSLFCKISLLCLPHCHPARIPCTLCSSLFCTLYAIPIQCTICLLCLSAAALHLLLCTHIPHNNNDSISSLFPILILPVHLVHCLYPMVLHPLHVECSACSLWKLFSFSVCSCHLSIITGCHNQFLCLTIS